MGQYSLAVSAVRCEGLEELTVIWCDCDMVHLGYTWLTATCSGVMVINLSIIVGMVSTS